MPDTPDRPAVAVTAAIKDRSTAGIKENELQITVTNEGPTPLGQMIFEIKLSTAWVDRRLGEAARKANENGKLTGPVGDAVTLTLAGWSAVVVGGEAETVTLRVGQLDRPSGGSVPVDVPLGAGASVTIKVKVGSGHVETMPYQWKTGGRGASYHKGEVSVKTPDVVVEPVVSFRCDQKAPLMIPPGSLVKLSWTTRRATDATIRGPLPGGLSEIPLSTKADDTYRAADGFIYVLAVGPATYVLTAVVPGAKDGEQVQVVRTLSLDVAVPEKYGFIRPRRSYVLPRTLLHLDWAAWGVEQQITLRAGNRGYERLTLTELDLSDKFRGAAAWRLWEPGDAGPFTVSMHYTQLKTEVEVDLDEPDDKPDDDAGTVHGPTVTVQSWRKLGPAGGGAPVALAHSGSTLGLLTDQGLWLATARGSSDNLGAWGRAADPTAGSPGGMALAAVAGGFAILRRESTGGLRLIRVDEQGRTSDRRLPIDLPAALGALANRTGFRPRMVALNGSRLLVTGDADGQRRSYAVTLDAGGGHDDVGPEPVLDTFPAHDLVVAADGLYAIDRTQVRMYRFDIAANGALSPPDRAEDPRQDGRPLLVGGSREEGLLVTIDDVLVVALGARGRQVLPERERLDVTTAHPTDDDRPDETVTMDMVYNPQTDRWSVCGNGLTIPAGAVAAARGGTRPRAWVIAPDRTVHTLTGADRELFATDYRQYNVNLDLDSAVPDTTTITLVNWGRNDRATLDKRDGPGAVTLRGRVTVEPTTCTLRPGGRQTFTVRHDRTVASEVVLRFKAEAGLIHEIVLSGTDLATITSRWRRRTSGDGPLQDAPFGEMRHAGSEVVLTDPSGFVPGATVPLTGLVATGAGVSSPAGHYVYLPLAEKNDPSRRRVRRLSASDPRDFQEISFTGGDVASKPNVVLAGYQKVSVTVDPAQPPRALDFAAGTATSERSDEDGPFHQIARAGTGSPDTRTMPEGDITVVLKPDDRPRPESAVDGKVVDHDWSTGWTTSGPADRARSGDSRVRLKRMECRMWDAPGQDGPGNEPRTAALWKWGSSAHLAVSHDGSAVALNEIGHVAVQPQNGERVDQWVTFGEATPDPDARQYVSRTAPGPIVFSPDGRWVYSGHAQHVWNVAWPLEPDSSPSGPCTGARDTRGRNILVGRMPASGGQAKQVTLLDADDWWITGIDRKDRQSWNAARKEVAFSLLVSPDGRSLFVTTGRSIHRIDTEKFEHTWKETVESPCRLVHVGRGADGNTWAVTVLQGRYESSDTGSVSGTFSLRTVAAPVR